MSEIELKACPFCGAGADYLIVDHLEGTVMHPAFCIRCDYCGASCPHTDRGDHVSIWNTRAPQWQPIETAPKDGTRIIVGYGRQTGFPVKVVSFNGLMRYWSHYGNPELGLDGNATHWMPLPEPPNVP